MSSVKAPDRDRITVKIHNMKRSASRDSPPIRTKRRSSIGRYDDSSDEERTSIRRRIRSPSPPPRYGSPHREEYARPREIPPAAVGHTYKVLCVSALHPKAPDEFIKETLYREYKKFGDFNIKISHDLDERVAYVCFRTADVSDFSSISIQLHL
jgi:RNA-binding protein 15